MHQAYIDDSGLGQPPVFVLAGFIASAEQWASFSQEWKLALEVKPKIEYFKMAEAANLSGEFCGWTEDKRDDRVKLLLNIINRYTVIGVRIAIAHEAYKKIYAKKISKTMDNPYWLSFFKLMVSVVQHQQSCGIDDPIDFIFDDQGHQNDQVLAGWRFFKELAPPQVKSLVGDPPIFRNEKKVLPLQGADMHAWMVRRTYEDHAKHKTPMILRWVTDTSMAIPCLATEMGEAEIKELFDRTEALKKHFKVKHPYDVDPKGVAKKKKFRES